MMKKIAAFSMFLFTLAVHGFTQTSITAAEYFFDTDPGIGNANPVAVAAADTVSANLSIPVSSLGNGRHLFCFRTKDNLGNWSHASVTQFVVEPKAAQLNKAEFFFDADPGPGNGTSLTLPLTDSLLGNFSLPLSGVSNGSHLFCLRTKDNAGNWSHITVAPFLAEPKGTALIKGEYYLDTDPGIGNAIPFNFTAADTVYNNFNLPLPAVPLGLHNLCIRVKDNAGNWNFPTCTFFQAVPVNNACTDVEYYFDTDPGVGNGTPLNLNLLLDTISLNNMSIPVPLSTPVGTHYLFTRSKTNGGVFSLAQIDTFDVTFNPIPVNLLYFTVGKINQWSLLRWSTSQEQNNRGFEVQRSTDGIGFSSIGFVNGSGTTARASHYQFTDALPVNGKNFYRLKQTDLDGRFKLSEIKRIDFGKDIRPVVSPNPFSNVINLINVDDKTAYRILNTHAQIVLQGIILNNKINTAQLPGGIYILELFINDAKEFIKLVKQ